MVITWQWSLLAWMMASKLGVTNCHSNSIGWSVLAWMVVDMCACMHAHSKKEIVIIFDRWVFV